MTLQEVLELKEPNDLWHYMNDNIKYGWTNKQGEFKELSDPSFRDDYYIHNPEETVKYGSGICGDQVLLEKEWFNYHNMENHTVSYGFINDEGKRIGGGHIFLYYIQDNKYYYFEVAEKANANIVEFDSLEELIGTVIAASLLINNKADKIDNIYLSIDPSLVAGDNNDQNFIRELNDIDVVDKFKEYIKEGIKKFS